MKKMVRQRYQCLMDQVPDFYSWNRHYDELVFDSRIVEKVLNNKKHEITEEFLAELGYNDVYCGGVKNLEVEWIDKGLQFEITEYDGREEIHIIGNRNYLKA